LLGSICLYLRSLSLDSGLQDSRIRTYILILYS